MLKSTTIDLPGIVLEFVLIDLNSTDAQINSEKDH